MLLSRGAVEIGLEICAPDDFTDERLAAMFAAITDLYHAGSPIDPVTVTARLTEIGKLDRVGGNAAVMRVQAGTPASAHIEAYAETVARYAAARRAMAVGQEVMEAGALADLDAVGTILDQAPDRIAVPATAIDPAERIDAFLAARPAEYDWLVEDMLERQDRLILTGEEGQGKSVWLRQLAWQISGGFHPIYGSMETRRTVLHVDCENTRSQTARGYEMLAKVRSWPEQPLYVVCRPQGLDLTTRRDAAWLSAMVGYHQAELLVIGPLYKLHRPAATGGMGGEDVAMATAQTLDSIRAAFGTAILIEAHAPMGDGRVHENFRPFGSSLWLRWPEFGLGIKRGAPDERKQRQTMVVERWRGHRDDTRVWPSALVRSPPGSWPWITE